MCVIVIKPRGKSFPVSIMSECWAANPNGAGLMYASGGNLVIKKGFMKLKQLKTAWRDLADSLMDTDVIFHFRIATSGNVNAEMCHPFRVSDELALAHNGILPITVPIGSEESDTAIFAKWLAEHPLGIDTDFETIEEWMGVGNKMAFLTPTGKVRLLNPAAWKDHKGLVFSNLNWNWTPPKWYSKGWFYRDEELPDDLPVESFHHPLDIESSLGQTCCVCSSHIEGEDVFMFDDFSPLCPTCFQLQSANY